MEELFTFTKKGNKHAWLVYDNEGKGEIIATLRVTKEEFWAKLGKGLGIKIVYPSTVANDKIGGVS